MAVTRTVVQIEVDGSQAELASDALWQARPSAVLEVDLGDGRVRLTADVADTALVDAIWAPTLLNVDDDGYLDAWRTWATPIRAGRRTVLHPAWLPGGEAVGPDDVVLVLDPGRSFGSGSHESTRLAVALMEDLVAPGVRVLDVGCGSGVLAALAALLGATEVVAIDIEPGAVVATEANAAANAVAERVSASTAGLGDIDGPFDLVVANIGGGTLFDLAPQLVARVGPGGWLVLSGVLTERLDALVTACPGCAELRRVTEAGWSAVALRRG